MRKSFIFILPIIYVLMLICCDQYLSTPFIEDSTDQGITSSGEILELNADPNSLDISGGGTVMISVRLLYPNQRPIVGEVVKLSATLGTLEENELTTDSDGCAYTTLSPGEKTGWSIIVATYRSARAQVAVSFYDSSGSEGREG